MGDRWTVPFTKPQVAALEEYQHDGAMVYLCETDGHPPLIPTESGWYCKGRRCEFQQVWADEIPVTFLHELIALDLVSQTVHSTDPDDPWPSMRMRSRREAAELAIVGFVAYLRRQAVDERASRFELPGRADDLDSLADDLARLL